MEQMGTIKEGSYDKMIGRKKSGVPVEDTINQLRKQMFKSIGKK